MTLEELEEALNEERAKNARLEQNIKNQNSYITKLENQRGGAATPQTGGTPAAAQLDPTLQKYLEDQMRNDITAKAITQIKSEVSAEEYAAVEPDFLEFLNRNMNKSNTRIDYVLDAFSLVYGRVKRDKNHAINQIGAKGTTPSATAPVKDAGTNQGAIDAVNQTISTKPPMMTGNDANAASGAPDTGTGIKNTKDAFGSLREKFGQIGANRFS
jgi:hypothetical protein